MRFYDFEATLIHGGMRSFSAYEGRVCLIVNTASECGFTPQYRGLQELHQQFGPFGLSVLGFPSNQFMGQEPKSNAEIQQYVFKEFGVTFDMFEKTEVNGPGAHPLYVWLKKQKPGFMGTEGIKWNFTKFLVDCSGKVVKRYSSDTEPRKLTSDIEELLTSDKCDVAA